MGRKKCVQENSIWRLTIENVKLFHGCFAYATNKHVSGSGALSHTKGNVAHSLLWTTHWSRFFSHLSQVSLPLLWLSSGKMNPKWGHVIFFSIVLKWDKTWLIYLRIFLFVWFVCTKQRHLLFLSWPHFKKPLFVIRTLKAKKTGSVEEKQPWVRSQDNDLHRLSSW